MISATCCNCAPMLVVGNCVFNGVDLASAAASADASAMLCDSVSFAACASETPVLVESRFWIAASPAAGPFKVSDCPGASATGCVDEPAPSMEFPASEKNVGKLDELMFCEAM